MTLDELNAILINQNRNVAIEKFRTCYECFSIHTNKLYAVANTVEELYTKLLKANLIY
nr:MAG TPA: hypothetical protein [Caudoviricetes sp.]